MTTPCGTPTRRAFMLSGLTATLLPAISFAQSRAIPPKYPRGATVPPRIKFLMTAQNAAAASLNRYLASDAEFMKTNPRIAAAPPKIGPTHDLRPYLTPVRNQNSCGSCWAFAAVGAYEGTYAMTNGQWAYVSEQELLDCTFADANCITGGWHEQAFLYMQHLGVIDANRYYYTGAKGACIANFERNYFVLNWGYVAQADNQITQAIPSDTDLKAAILQHGPLATGVWTTGWDAYRKFDDSGNQNSSWYADYPDGVFKGLKSDNDPTHVDHEVVLVGWNDNIGDHGAWIVRNSWGTLWGDSGYMYLQYGSNNIGFGASWVTVPPSSGISASLAEMLQIQNQSARFGLVPK
jgi:hypothetical protein